MRASLTTLAFLGVFATFPLFAQTSRPLGLLEDEQNTIDVFARASDVTVNVSTIVVQRDIFSFDTTEVPAGTGTGFLWDTSGHIVTNFHVIQDANRVVVHLKTGDQLPARLVGAEPRKDIAVLKVELPAGFKGTPLPVGNSTILKVGQKAIAIGSPFGLDQTLTRGVVSALGRSIQGIGGVTIRDMIQTDASINPGNSGGPLLNSRAELIGMNTMIFSKSGSSAGIGFAVPSNTIKRTVDQLIKYGRVQQPGLGISMLPDDIAARMGLSGVIVMELQLGGPAANAGLRGTTRGKRGKIALGDRIVAVDQKPIANYDDLYNALDQRKPGDEVEVAYVRDNKKIQVKMRLADVADMR